MSWRASAWAKEQRLGSPAAKSILLCLADFADGEGRCWPSQTQLAADAEVSERTAREWLQRLEDWGLIDRTRRARPNGARASDVIVLRLDARVTDGMDRCREIREDSTGCGAGEADSLPAEIAGRTYRQPETEPTGNQAQPTGNGCRASKEEPPIEPPKETSQTGAREARPGEREGRSDRGSEKQFWRIVKNWPGFDGMPKEAAKPHFLALDQADRDAAERRLPGWLALLKAQRKDHVPAPSTYFRERLFEVVADPLDGPKPPVEAKPFGKVWGAIRMRRLLTEGPVAAPPAPRAMADLLAEASERGAAARLDRQARHGWPSVNFMHEQAANRKGISVPAEEERLGELTEPVRLGTPLRAAWKDEHARRGWPWPDEFDRVEWIWFPAGGPAGLEDFERKVRGHDGDRQEAAE